MEERQEGGLDFTANIEDKRDHVDPLWTCRMFGHKPPCRAMRALAPRFRYACSAIPIKQSIDQMDCFVPPSGFEPASTVLQTVALPFKLQRRARQAIFGSSGHKPFPGLSYWCVSILFARGRKELAAAYPRNRLMRLRTAIYRASCPDGITISGPSA